MDQNNYLATAIQISRMRKERVLTQAELAQLVGVSRQTIAKAESGLSFDSLKLGTIAKIFEVLGVNSEPPPWLQFSELNLSPVDILQSFTRHYAHLSDRGTLVYAHLMTGELVAFNDTYQAVLGYPATDLMGRDVPELLTRLSCDRSHEMRAKKLAGEFVTTYVIEYTGKGGEIIKVKTTSQLIFEKDKVIGIQGRGRVLR